MKHEIKAAFFDVDGTLYAHRHHDVPASAQQALYALHDQGIKISIATSRCRYEFANVPGFLRAFPFDGYIFDGGSTILEHDQMVKLSPIERSDMDRILSYTSSHDLLFRYATYDQDYFHQPVSTDIKDAYFYLYLNVPSVKPYEGEEVTNILLYTKHKGQNEELRQLLHSTPIIDHGSVIELTGQNMNKAEGIRVLMNRWGMAMEHSICFGDGANDVTMMKEAGIGVAMGNANPACKAAADLITDHIEQDGIYSSLKKLSLI